MKWKNACSFIKHMFGQFCSFFQTGSTLLFFVIQHGETQSGMSQCDSWKRTLLKNCKKCQKCFHVVKFVFPPPQKKDTKFIYFFLICLFFLLGLGSSVYQSSQQNLGTVQSQNRFVKSKNFQVRSQFPNLPARLHANQRMKTPCLEASYPLLHRLLAPFLHQYQLDRLLTLLILKEPPSLSLCGCATVTASGYHSPLHDQSKEKRGVPESPVA